MRNQLHHHIYAPLFLLMTMAFSMLAAQAGILWKLDWEDGRKEAAIGYTRLEEEEGGEITVVDNPVKDANNGSEKAAACNVGGKRAEISSQRVPTEGKTYVYKWSYLVPENYSASGLVCQWKTWPCGDHDGYADEVCYTCGIFNHVRIQNNGDEFHFQWRAEPDCDEISLPTNRGSWVTFQQEIKWTNGNDGYYKLWMNGEVVKEDSNLKTLMDRFEPGTCDLYFAVGLYSTVSALPVYIDNVEIWDTSGVQGIIGEDSPTSIIRQGRQSVYSPTVPFEPLNTPCRCSWCVDEPATILDVKGVTQGTLVPGLEGGKSAQGRLPNKRYILRQRAPDSLKAK
ncbi:heparin lyase I family protein [Fibrobacterota bacterium]